MKKIIFAVATMATLVSGAKSFEDSPLFVKRIDPYSGVVSYILKPKVHSFNQQGFYFTDKCVTDDGRFFLFSASDSPTSCQKRVVVVDIEKETFTELPREAKPRYLDAAAGHLYWLNEKGLHRCDLAADMKTTLLCPFPVNLETNGVMKCSAGRISFSADRKKVFSLVRRRKMDRWLPGFLDIATGTFEKWIEVDYALSHCMVNPTDPGIAICAREPGWTDIHGKKHRVHPSPCGKGCPRLNLLTPGKIEMVPLQNDRHATHECWADDGKGFYWCAGGGNGVWYHDLASGKQCCICPRKAVHAAMDPSNRYVVFDNSFGTRYRGCAWQVGFYNRETGLSIYPFTGMDPLNTREKLSTLHPDPHPQFVMGGKYITLTVNNADGHMDVAVVPVAQLVEKTSAAFSPDRQFAAWPDGADPATVSRRLSEQFLSTPAEAYKPVGCDTARHSYGGGRSVMYCVASLWAHGLDCAALAGQRDLERRLLERFWPLLDEKKGLVPQPGHVDRTVFGGLPLEVAYLTGNPAALKLGLHFADAQWEAPGPRTTQPRQNLPLEEQIELHKKGYTPESRYWIDDMYMITFLQVQAYRATGDMKYLSRAAKELALYIERLQRADGLFEHAPGVPFVWGRGDGWVAGGLTLVMTHLPVTDPHYPVIQEGYLKMMNALLRTQRENGLWGQLVDDPESWTETSGSAMFTYGMVAGVKMGLLDACRFAPAARKAYLALVERLDRHGNLADVCEGTAKVNDREHYMKRPRVNGAPYGQAGLMWVCNALLEKGTWDTPATTW